MTSGNFSCKSMPLIRQIKDLEQVVNSDPPLRDAFRDLIQFKKQASDDLIATVPGDLFQFTDRYGLDQELFELNVGNLSGALWDTADIQTRTAASSDGFQDILLNQPFQAFQGLFKTIDYFLEKRADASTTPREISWINKVIDYLVALSGDFVSQSSKLLETRMYDGLGSGHAKVPDEVAKYKQFIVDECLAPQNMPSLATNHDLIRSMHLPT
jgi:hypothetical protein